MSLKLKIFTSTKNAESEKLQKLSGPTIEWIFGASDREVGNALGNAYGFIMPQEEDFGIVALEAMSHGIPVIAYSKGGAQETIIDEKTGILFPEQTVESLSAAILRSEKIPWNADDIIHRSEEFSEERFERGIRKIVDV